MTQKAAMAAAKAAPVIQRAACIAMLHEALAKAGGSASFNLESQKSDLMTKFRNISSVNLEHMLLQEHRGDLSQMMNRVSD